MNRHPPLGIAGASADLCFQRRSWLISDRILKDRFTRRRWTFARRVQVALHAVDGDSQLNARAMGFQLALVDQIQDRRRGNAEHPSGAGHRHESTMKFSRRVAHGTKFKKGHGGVMRSGEPSGVVCSLPPGQKPASARARLTRGSQSRTCHLAYPRHRRYRFHASNVRKRAAATHRSNGLDQKIRRREFHPRNMYGVA